MGVIDLWEKVPTKAEIDALEKAVEATKKSVSDGKTTIAAAITQKGITTAATDTFGTMADNIQKIVTLANGTADATATAADLLSGKTAYAKGKKLTGTMPIQAAQTITPGTANKTIAAGRYLSGVQTIKGDANLKAANIKKGVSIFGVAGDFEGTTTVLNASQVVYGTHIWVASGSSGTISSFSPITIVIAFQNRGSNATQSKTVCVWYTGAETSKSFGDGSRFSLSDDRKTLTVGIGGSDYVTFVWAIC